MAAPKKRWRTIRGGVGDYKVDTYYTKEARDENAQRLANLDNENVITEVWSAEHPQDCLNLGWACDGHAQPLTSVVRKWLENYHALDAEQARVVEMFAAANVGEGSFEAADTARFDLNEKLTELTHTAAEIFAKMPR